MSAKNGFKDDGGIIVLGPNEPDLDKMQKHIMSMLEKGNSVEDIALSLKIDPQKLGQLVANSPTSKWQNMPHSNMLDEYLKVINEMVDLGKLEYLNSPVPPNAFAVASLVKTANEIINNMNLMENGEEKKKKVVHQVLEPLMENTIRHVSQELSTIKTKLLNTVPENLHPEINRFVEDVLESLGVVLEQQYTDSQKKLETILVGKEQKSSAKKTNSVMDLVPNANPLRK